MIKIPGLRSKLYAPHQRNVDVAFFLAENENLLILADENGEKVEFEYLDTVEFNSREYIILYPIDDAGEEVVILQLIQYEDGSDEFVPVEKEEELNSIFEIFKDRMKDKFHFVDDEDY